jgi:L-alanine-DL-glutamate epimerase-like enolase superfamily enzyme
MVDTPLANPMSVYADGARIGAGDVSDAVGGVLVEIAAENGTVGYATGVGGVPACCIIERHLKHFLIDRDVDDTVALWDLMYRACMPYGRGGIALLAMSVVDLALWDLRGRLHRCPVFMLAGTSQRRQIPAYCSGPIPTLYQAMGFWGAKFFLPYGPGAGKEGLDYNIETIAKHRKALGWDYPFMLDCYMGLDIDYAEALARATEPYRLYWIEEALPPDNIEGFQRLKRTFPDMRWVAGEHEYSRFGFNNLIASGAIDILQPDLMWCGGMTEALRIGALAAQKGVPVVPHAGGVYSYHFAAVFASVPFVEYCITSPGGDEIHPVFGDMFDGEPLPVDGKITLSDRPGWGLELRRDKVVLKRSFSD